MPRTSQSELGNLSRPASSSSLNTAALRKTDSKATIKTAEPGRVTSAEVKGKSADAIDKRTSALSAVSTASTAPQNKEEAVLKTMRSLEGGALAGHAAEKGKILRKIPSKRDVLAKITRPAPEPPRPQSLDSAKSAEGAGAAKKGKDEQRRSLGVERRLEELQEEAGRYSEESLRGEKRTQDPVRAGTKLILDQLKRSRRRRLLRNTSLPPSLPPQFLVSDMVSGLECS
jgi:hypothetical protein